MIFPKLISYNILTNLFLCLWKFFFQIRFPIRPWNFIDLELYIPIYVCVHIFNTWSGRWLCCSYKRPAYLGSRDCSPWPSFDRSKAPQNPPPSSCPRNRDSTCPWRFYPGASWSAWTISSPAGRSPGPPPWRTAELSAATTSSSSSPCLIETTARSDPTVERSRVSYPHVCRRPRPPHTFPFSYDWSTIDRRLWTSLSLSSAYFLPHHPQCLDRRIIILFPDFSEELQSRP